MLITRSFGNTTKDVSLFRIVTDLCMREHAKEKERERAERRREERVTGLVKLS